MKNCREIQSGLSAFLDGEVPVRQRAEVEAHLQECTRCRQHLTELQNLAAGIAALPSAVPTPRFLAEVRAKLRGPEESEPQRTWIDALFRPYWLKVPMEAVAVMVVLATVVFLLNTEPRPRHLELAQAPAPAEPALAYPSSAPVAVVAKEKSADEHGVKVDALAMKQMMEPSAPVDGDLFKREDLALKLPVSKDASLERGRLAGQVGAVAGAPPASAMPAVPAAEVVGDRQLMDARTGVLAGMALRSPAEAIVVETADFAELQKEVAEIAIALNGRVVKPSSPAKAGVHARNLWVELPAANVAPFKVQLAADTKRKRDVRFEFAAPAAPATGEAAARSAGELGFSAAQPSAAPVATSGVRRLAEKKAAKPTIRLSRGVPAPTGGADTSVTAETEETLPTPAPGLAGDSEKTTVLEIQVIPPRK